MPKCFSIDFIRQAFEQKLYEEHLKSENYFGGKNQVNIFSFYEQLKTQDDVDRYVERYRDLSDQQNRSGLILNGVIVAPENPTITNLYSSTIIPMTWTCSMRCTLENRDQSLDTINNLIEKLKGRKVDIAELKCRDKNNHVCYKPFMVGTIGQYEQEPTLKDGDYICDATNTNEVIARFNELKSLVKVDYNKTNWLFYVGNQNKLKVANLKVNKGNEDLVDGIYGGDIIYDARYVYGEFSLLGEWEIENLYPFATGYILLYGDETKYLQYENGKIEILEIFESGGEKYTKVGLTFDLGDTADNLCPGWNGTFDIDEVNVYATTQECSFIENDGTYKDFIFPPTHDSFEKYKLSFSFDAIRCDEPRNLNANEYCDLSFGGSATLVNESVQLGNDLVKLSVKKLGILAQTPIDFTNDQNNPTWWLEPLEMPSGSNANTNPIQLMSNRFIANSHTDALALTLQYTFIYDKSVQLLKQLFMYARYGTQGLTKNDISPNMIFEIKEIWSSWGEFEDISFKAKIVENVDIENTESDTLTLSLTMQLQGDNN